MSDWEGVLSFISDEFGSLYKKTKINITQVQVDEAYCFSFDA